MGRKEASALLNLYIGRPAAKAVARLRRPRYRALWLPQLSLFCCTVAAGQDLAVELDTGT